MIFYNVLVFDELWQKANGALVALSLSCSVRNRFYHMMEVMEK